MSFRRTRDDTVEQSFCDGVFRAGDMDAGKRQLEPVGECECVQRSKLSNAGLELRLRIHIVRLLIVEPTLRARCCGGHHVRLSRQLRCDVNDR